MTNITSRPTRDFTLSDAEYREIRDRIYKLAGINLGDHKQDLVYSRLTKRIRALGLGNFASYLNFVDSPEGESEVEYMLNALTTNLTSFFREAHHFEHLKDTALKALIKNPNGGDRRLRIWCSACSTGEEPYSIAMTLLESGIDLGKLDIKILATDLNTEVLAQASSGNYSPSVLSKCPPQYRSYFRSKPNGEGEIKENVKELISFRQLNLLGNWPMKGKFDIVFCRNVLIYFDNVTKNKLVDRFANILRPEGWLYLGHSESASGNHSSLAPTGRTIYRKCS